jgi:hypothetical protein
MAITLEQPNLRVRQPLAERAPMYMLIETRGANDTHDKEKIDQFLSLCMQEGFISDGTLAQDSTQVCKCVCVCVRVRVCLCVCVAG